MTADLNSVDFEEFFHKFECPDGASGHASVPFGYLQCSFEKYPKVLRINRQMLHFLEIPPEGTESVEYLKANVFFMIPFEDRGKFMEYLRQAGELEESVPIFHKVTRSTGENVDAAGCIQVLHNEKGEKIFSIFYYNIGWAGSASGSTENSSYFAALESAYNLIFEINYEANMVKCIYGRDTSDIGKLWDVHMSIESAIAFWVNHYVVEEDRLEMTSYLREIATPGVVESAHRPMQIEFRIIWEDGQLYSFIGVTIRLSKTSALFCCRDTAKVQYSSMQAREINSLRKLHGFIEKSFQNERSAIGSIILSTEDAENWKVDKKHEIADSCRFELIFASESVRDWLNIRYDQYLLLLENGLAMPQLREIASSRQIRSLDALFIDGSLKVEDPANNQTIILTSSLQSSGVLVILATKDVPGPVAGVPAKGVFARTFGYFDLFVDGEPVVFASSKEKELLALLIDRNGGTLSSAEAIGLLWEDESPTESVRVRYRKLAMGLKKTLTRYGIERMLISENGVRRVDTGTFTCDYYELLKGNVKYVQSFHNSYMSDYSWSERTIGTLWDYS